MIKLFSVETFRDYVDNPQPPQFLRNGDMVLSPSDCKLLANRLTGVWTLTLTHPLDEDGKYTYIQKGCVIGVDCKIAREQTSKTQFFRIYEANYEPNQIVAQANPVAMESAYEVPFNQVTYEDKPLSEIVTSLSNRYPNKYSVDTDMSAEGLSIYMQNTNLQEVLNGNQSAALCNLLGCELVYDNYGYHLVEMMGDIDINHAKDRLIKYGLNVTGMTATESTTDMITRIYPTSYEGYTLGTTEAYIDDTRYVNAENYQDYPYVFAKSIKYSDVKLIDEQSDDDRNQGIPETDTQRVVREVKAIVQAKARELSEKYLRKAHDGDWDNKKGTNKRWWYGTKDENGNAKYYAKNQYLYSYRDSSWYWFDTEGWYVDGSTIDDETLAVLNNYDWHQDATGWYYGDGRGHYISNGWVEDKDGAHYWMDADGYLDSQYDNLEPWNWYGSKEDHEYHNPHDPDKPYDEREDRIRLPYGYLFYSYNHAMGVLAEKCMKDLITDENEYNMFTAAIQKGFKWCETTDIALWDWRAKTVYTDTTFGFLGAYHWHQNDQGQWWFGDDEDHYIFNAWVEDEPDKHYWINSLGYLESQYNDYEQWDWYSDENGWWYGNKNPDGTVKNCAKEQYIYDSRNRSWYWFNGDGYFVDGSYKRWWYGTKDASDYVFFRYHQIGSYIYWFDAEGYIDKDLAYADKYEWRTDATGDYYGDGKGHWLKNCWVEDSASKHYWINEDGYRDESKTDEAEWTWHGNWTDGWWYGSDVDEDDDDDDDDEEGIPEGGSSAIKSKLQRIQNVILDSNTSKSDLVDSIDGILGSTEYDDDNPLHDIQVIVDNEGSYTRSGLVDAIQSVIDNSGYDIKKDSGSTSISVKSKLKSIKTIIDDSTKYKAEIVSDIDSILGSTEYAESSTLGQIRTVIDNSTDYSKEGLIAKINEIINNSGYNIDDTTPSGATSETDPTTAKNYVHGQFLYVTENSSWYWFNNDGYATAVWMVDASWEWEKDTTGWWYGDGKGNYPAGQWMKIDGNWYFFDSNGYADTTTDDFDVSSKTAEDKTATWDYNLDGLGGYQEEETEDEKESKYDDTREGVRAWIQEDFIKEMKQCITEQHNVLLKEMRRQLKERAEYDLASNCNPKVTLEVEFDSLYNSQNYEGFDFLKEYYLGDMVQIFNTELNIEGYERVDEIEYDCILNKPTKITIGDDLAAFITNVSGLYTPGIIIAYNPEDGLEDGEGNYLSTGYNTKLSVK